jgi:hypothetical protein
VRALGYVYRPQSRTITQSTAFPGKWSRLGRFAAAAPLLQRLFKRALTTSSRPRPDAKRLIGLRCGGQSSAFATCSFLARFNFIERTYKAMGEDNRIDPSQYFLIVSAEYGDSKELLGGSSCRMLRKLLQ